MEYDDYKGPLDHNRVIDVVYEQPVHPPQGYHRIESYYSTHYSLENECQQGDVYYHYGQHKWVYVQATDSGKDIWPPTRTYYMLLRRHVNQVTIE